MINQIKCIDQNCDTILCSEFIGELWDLPKCTRCYKEDQELGCLQFKIKEDRSKIKEINQPID